MFTTDQAMKIVESFTHIILRQSAEPSPEGCEKMEKAKSDLIAVLTGSSRIERSVDPNTETQMVEVVNPEAEKERDLIEGKLLMLDDLMMRHRKLHETLVRYVGCTPDKLHIRSRDLLFMVVDIGLLMRVAAGPWLDVVDQIEVDERERRAQTLFAARSTENLAPEMLKAKKAAGATEGQPDATNG